MNIAYQWRTMSDPPSASNIGAVEKNIPVNIVSIIVDNATVIVSNLSNDEGVLP
jgi:hypothetical protein